MNKKRIVVFFSLFILLMFVNMPDIHSDATSYDGEGGALLPIQNDDIKMVSERITFIQLDSYNWEVKAQYTFMNSSDKSKVVQVGFPEIFGSFGWWDGYEKTSGINNFEAKVNGNDINFKKEKHGCDNEKKYCFDAVYLFNVNFIPREEVNIEYKYITCASGANDIEDLFINFILVTGALWDEKIGKIELIYHFGKYTSEGNSFPNRMLVCDSSFPLDCYFDSIIDDNEYGCCEPLLHSSGSFWLWNGSAKFSYNISSNPKGMTLYILGDNIEPEGNISIAYDYHR